MSHSDLRRHTGESRYPEVFQIPGFRLALPRTMIRGWPEWHQNYSANFRANTLAVPINCVCVLLKKTQRRGTHGPWFVSVKR